jgi:hypothetical protein
MNKYVIHLQDRSDREGFVTELSQQGIDDYVVINPEKIGVKGLLKAMQGVIKLEYENPYVLIMQDDIQFHSGQSWHQFLLSVKKCKNENKTIYLISGGSQIVDNTTEISEPYFRMKDFALIHFVLYFKPVYDLILNINPDDVKCLDRYIVYITSFGNEYNAFCCYPMVCRQRPGYSTLRRMVVNDESVYRFPDGTKYKFI